MKKIISNTITGCHTNVYANTDCHQFLFTTLFKSYSQNLYVFAYRLTKSKTLSEDIVHDVFLKLWIKRTELDSVENLSSYLYMMTRNRILDRHKKCRREILPGDDSVFNLNSAESIEDNILSKEYDTILNKAIALMPSKQQLAYRLVREKGLPQKQAAETLQISVLTVKKHISNGLKFIQTHFEKNGILIISHSKYKIN